jgi:hypothetical protein
MIGLTPAYGHDYKLPAEVSAAYNAGKDFIIADISNRWHGKPANNADLAPEGKVKIRYNKLTKVVILNATTGEVTV